MDINWHQIVKTITKNLPNKNLGQNFLTNYEIIKNILKSVVLNDNILEIGPGSAILSYGILQCMKPGGTLTLVEKDKNFIDNLKTLLKPIAQEKSITLNIIEGDGLLYEPPSPVQVISNIPYNLSSQLFYQWLSNPVTYPSLVIMVQKEFGDKILNKKSNNLGILANVLGNVRSIMDLDRKSFIPAPQVDSQVIHYENKINDEKIVKLLKLLLREAFSKPRKQLKNNIKNHQLKKFLLINNYGDKRAENLTIKDYYDWILSII